jgi:mycothiol S-conjugate amidase
MAEAAAVLGVRHEWLGFMDSGLPEGDPPPPLPEGCFALQPLEAATAPLVAMVRAFRPHVITTYDENGGYPHPDHIMCHRVSLEAFQAAPDAERYPDAGEPWQPLKLYYHAGFSRSRMMAFHEALLAAGRESPIAQWLDSWPDDRVERTITTRVECAKWFGRRDRALLAHATQIDPDGWFFLLPGEEQARLWPTEDYELAGSVVPTDLPEDDLFAGVRDRVRV